ncbi:hypothetical protein BSZ22_20690 [Bradyrhizobium canariense]|uniref:Uncharacterized protein n=1 Tax=Bradyrhizobium canariense TaxID=255045 RepID=A0A1X3H3B5_9BRAD|nr:hypothetical protein BSZ22_20690 [Bradyrhizobium canariense]OSI78036.1 hypothetical protein BSZ23_19690 [Bradyrhizobium canariense]OSI89266.1 hypothetical protein BSZ25_21160 [Bradyrhizobium canariense]OSI93748.1 hypothetical protein BSZ24_12390 [Bradyrhizobium canariense]OSJ03065.1 hypothetical protein BSZ16_16585 [Bradyrhizobium canariense]
MLERILSARVYRHEQGQGRQGDGGGGKLSLIGHLFIDDVEEALLLSGVAAPGGLDDQKFAWGNELVHDGKHMPTPGREISRSRTVARTVSSAPLPVTAFPPSARLLQDRHL